MKHTHWMKALAVLAASGLALGAASARADNDYRHDGVSAYGHNHGFRKLQLIDARQDNQMRRIKNGAASDRLNRHEYRRLLDEQRRIQMVKHRFLDDRRLDEAEFDRLDRMLDRADLHIRMASSNQHEHWHDRS